MSGVKEIIILYALIAVFSTSVTAQGSVFKTIIKNGTGPVPLPNQTVVVHYTGTLKSGEKFDSSRDRNEPFKFKLGAGEVIAGWDAGVASMKVGERAQIEIPPEYAYGNEGYPPVIPPSATLTFDIELLAIEGVTQAPSDPQPPPSLGIPDFGTLMGTSNTMPPSSGGQQSFVAQPPQPSNPSGVPQGEVVTLGDLFSGSGFTAPSSGGSQPSFNPPDLPSSNNGVMRTSSAPQPGLQFGSSIRQQSNGGSGNQFGASSSPDGFSATGRSANAPTGNSFSRTLGADGFQSRGMTQSSSFGAGTPGIASNMLDSQRSFQPPSSPFNVPSVGSGGFNPPSMGSASGFPSGPSPSMGRPAPSGFPDSPVSGFGRQLGMGSRGASAASASATMGQQGPTFLGSSGMQGPGMGQMPAVPGAMPSVAMPRGPMTGTGGMPGVGSMSGARPMPGMGGMSSDPRAMSSFGASGATGDRFGSPMDSRPDMRLAEVRPDIRRFMGATGRGTTDPMIERMARFGGAGIPTGGLPRSMMGPMGPRMPGVPGMSPFMPGVPPFARSRMPPFMMRGMGLRRRLGMFRRR